MTFISPLTDSKSIQLDVARHAYFTLGRTRFNFDSMVAYQATALSLRDRLTFQWNETQQFFTDRNVKRVYYLSLEFLLGRSMQNALYNLETQSKYAEGLKEFGIALEDLYDQEKDAALGNGGLGRLAACFMDSIATTNLPGWGYGIRYSYGMFHQKILNGYQVELPDYWLTRGNPWEINRMDVRYSIPFYGEVKDYTDDQGRLRHKWIPGERVLAVASDVPIPGFRTMNTINIRLWGASPSKEFDLDSFNRGDYYAAVENKQKSENISSVLYPNDSTWDGKVLRLKQQYFFVAATLKDILRRFKKSGKPLTELHTLVAIQLNDTHPAIGIPELMRILIDEEGLEYDAAWAVVTKVYSFTNHTVLPEALERWPVDLLQQLLPRHLAIIYDINYRFLQIIADKFPGDMDKLQTMSIIEEGEPKRVRMANLAIIGSHTVNGVAAIHTGILKARIFPDFHALWPTKFQNKTNGITPRRWLHQANTPLADVVTKWLDESDDWITDLDQLQGLRVYEDNPDLHAEWIQAKQLAKQKLAAFTKAKTGITVSTEAMFDVHIKRFHEYKRQLINILGVIHRYIEMKAMSSAERAKCVPRVVFFAGKAAPAYYMAKLIIKLINNVSNVINHDDDIGDKLKVVFLPNYNVSAAEIIIPATDLSQQVSTAGTEASGTGNMKFSLNGGIIIGTLDGANIEIREEIGEKNMFIFGLTADQVDAARSRQHSSTPFLSEKFARVLDFIKDDNFGHHEEFAPILNSLRPENDHYLLQVDFDSYLRANEDVDAAWKDKERWTRMSILSTAGSGKFSSDRTILQYAKEIWGIKPAPVRDQK